MFKRQTKPTPGLQASREARIIQLKEEISILEKQLGGKDANAIVKEHIDLLHQYNEIKDAAQMLIGKHAIMTNTTIKQMHEDLGLSLTE